MPRVFIPNEQAFQTELADIEIRNKITAIGDIVFITKGFVDLTKTPMENTLAMMTLKLSEATEEDYLLIGGITILCVLAVISWMHTKPSVNLLLWRGRENDYYKFSVDGGKLASLLDIVSSIKKET